MFVPNVVPWLASPSFYKDRIIRKERIFRSFVSLAMITIDFRDFYSFSKSVGVVYTGSMDRCIFILNSRSISSRCRDIICSNLSFCSRSEMNIITILLGCGGQRMREQGEKIGEKPGRKGGQP